MNMNDANIAESLSALADKGNSDLTPEELDRLRRLVHERADLFEEYRLILATKLFLQSHSRLECCPKETADSIRAFIAYIYQARRAAL